MRNCNGSFITQCFTCDFSRFVLHLHVMNINIKISLALMFKFFEICKFNEGVWGGLAKIFVKKFFKQGVYGYFERFSF